MILTDFYLAEKHEKTLTPITVIKSVKVLASQLASKLPTRKTRFRVRPLAAQSPSNTLELPSIFSAVGLDYMPYYLYPAASYARETRWEKLTINVSINFNDFFTN